MDERALDPATVAAARLFAASRLPYLAAAVFAAPVLAAPGSGTVAIDERWRVHADPGVVAAAGAQELGRLLAHLLGHVLRDHAGRAVAADAEADCARWNRATDAELNDDLVAGAMVPASAPDQPADLGAEAGGLAEGYLAGADPAGRRWDCGSGCDGRPRPWDGDGDGLSPRDAEWLRLGVAAACQREEGSEPGTVAAGWLRWAERVLPSKLDWRRVLAAEIRAGIQRAAGMVDYSYRRPSRRAAVAPGVLLPTLEQPVPRVAVVCDTSGSMGEIQLAQALAEVEAIVRRVGIGDPVTVLAVDTAVHAARRVRRRADVALAGGGGTDMGEGIRAAAALRPRPDVVVVLTDGYTPWPPQPPRGLRVVVGLLPPPGARHPGERGPAWARTVVVGDAGRPAGAGVA